MANLKVRDPVSCVGLEGKKFYGVVTRLAMIDGKPFAFVQWDGGDTSIRDVAGLTLEAHP